MDRLPYGSSWRFVASFRPFAESFLVYESPEKAPAPTPEVSSATPSSPERPEDEKIIDGMMKDVFKGMGLESLHSLFGNFTDDITKWLREGGNPIAKALYELLVPEDKRGKPSVTPPVAPAAEAAPPVPPAIPADQAPGTPPADKKLDDKSKPSDSDKEKEAKADSLIAKLNDLMKTSHEATDDNDKPVTLDYKDGSGKTHNVTLNLTTNAKHEVNNESNVGSTVTVDRHIYKIEVDMFGAPSVAFSKLEMQYDKLVITAGAPNLPTAPQKPQPAISLSSLEGLIEKLVASASGDKEPIEWKTGDKKLVFTHLPSSN